MDGDRKKLMKKIGKEAVQRQSEALRDRLHDANSAPVGSDAWVRNYRQGLLREKRSLPTKFIISEAACSRLFVIHPAEGAGWVPHQRGFIQCTSCGSVAPSIFPPRFFYFNSCACRNMRVWSFLFVIDTSVRDLKNIRPVKLIGRGDEIEGEATTRE